MTPGEINRAIAEHVGWTEGFVDGSTPCWFSPDPCHIHRDPPPYSSSLDALHEALQSLSEVELFRYADEVCDLTCDSNHDTDIQTMLMLSAKELAECYVRAIGKWRDA